ncbi:outer membrane receptor protein involved in Fe transport [Povalibacter uvarum]|uniref:Outer membrane receptor protein involved in Fe transport n=1 Tax=Povalibacter uvarum TaxID=732238 RepID=A0A841HMK6_9GAMM|nr:TonB-dependent receptor [Povalibacter uvarum]MBB6093510.1 outer membrane receptor protein involved in Fe transport [Povalibacter uvarum]
MRNRTSAVTRASLLAMLASSAAVGQEAQPQSTPSDSKLEEIVVTGSRISRADFSSTSPIVTFGEDAITQTGTVNIESALNQLPQFVQGQTQSTIGAVALAGRASLNLRGLGETRNLVLLDGRRLPLSNANAVVDVNLIPQFILQGVETITGGASAVYGSDAMSGVVNFKSKNDVDGVQLDIRSGISDRGDANTTDVGITAGFAIDGGRGSVLLSAGYTDREELFGKERDFYQLGVLSSFIAQGTFIPSPTNLPTQAAVNGVFSTYGVAPGAVLNSRSLGINDDRTLFGQIGAVNYRGPTTEYFSTTGGTVRQPVTYQEYIVNPMERKSFFGKFDYDLTQDLTAYGQFLYNKTTATGQVGWTPTLYVVPTVPVTNPFIPADLRTILASRPNPNADFTINQRFMGLEDRKFPSDFTVGQYILGLRGNLPFKDWRWDVYGSYDSTDLVETQDKAILNSRMRNLLYAADGGTSICAGGFNPFSLAESTSVSAECRSYLEAETHDYTQLTQTIFEANLNGSLFSMPAGDVKFALTLSTRDNQFEFDPDPSRENLDIIGTLQTYPAEGSSDVKEAAIEFLVPLLADKPFAHKLDLSLGFRTSDYDVSGRVETYKADGIWEPFRGFTIRGGFEHAIRAPNIGELYNQLGAQAQIGSPPGQGDPCDVRSSARSGANAASVRALCIATGIPTPIADTYQYTTVAIGVINSGNIELTPEEADTVTLGVVFRPEFDAALVRDMQFSVDYYDIDITDVIGPIAGGTALSKCYNLDGSNPTYDAGNAYCQMINRNGTTGGVDTVATPYFNLGGLRTSGIDAQLDWKIPAGPGSLDVSLLANYTESYEVQLLAGSAWQQFAGTIDGTQNGGIPIPDWKTLLSLTYRLPNFEGGIRWRHLPTMDDITSVTRPASPAPGVPSYDLYDATLSYRLNDMFLFRGGVNNLLDEEPPIVGGTIGQTQPGTYDIIGRYYYFGLQMNF